jgi:hypothetical protein
MNDMGWEKYTLYTDYLLSDPSLDSGGMQYRNLVFALAGLGILLALIHRVRLGYFLALTVMVFAWIFRFFPQYRLWNARLLPFYYLTLYLLAGLALALVVRSVAIALQEWWQRREEPALVGAFGAGLVALVALVVLLGAFSVLPGGTPGTDPTNPKRSVYSWAGIDFETTIVHNWARYNYAGLEGKDAYPEFSGVIDTMRSVADEHGCGRAMWEYEGDLQRFGTPMALMLLPYFTDGCIGSMEGLYFESSTTTPFHFLNQSELSTSPSRAQRDLPYNAFDIQQGISHLQMTGVKYYMATSDAAIEAAHRRRLTEVADETFTYTDTTTGAPVEQNWVVFEVAEADVVVALPNEPVVLSDADDHIDGWVYAKETVEAVEGQPRPPKAPGPAVLWYNDPSRWDVLLATSGPDSWQRAPSTAAEVPMTANLDVEVTDVEVGTDTVSFRVADRRSRAGEDELLPQLAGRGRRRAVADRPQSDGRGAHKERGHAQLRAVPGRVDRPVGHAHGARARGLADGPGPPPGPAVGVGRVRRRGDRPGRTRRGPRRRPGRHGARRRRPGRRRARRHRPRATGAAVNLLRRFTLVGTTATVVDVAVFVVLASSVGWPVWWADAAAVAIATAVSWCLHALVTFPDDPTRGGSSGWGPT